MTDAVLTFNLQQTGTVQIVGARRPRRVSQFNENAGVPARNLNQVITDIIAMLRETWDKINDVTGRTVRAPPGETLNTLPPAASRANMGVCFDSNGNLAPCVGSSAGSFAPGTGITFTGTNPTTISAVPQPAGTVFGAGASVVGNVPSLSNTTTNSIVDSGNPAAALPTTIGQLPAATPSAAPSTISIASPAVITLTGHGLAPNSTIVFSTTGALPMG